MAEHLAAAAGIPSTLRSAGELTMIFPEGRWRLAVTLWTDQLVFRIELTKLT